MRESVRYFLARAAKWGAFGSLGVILIIIAAHFILKRPAAVEPRAEAVSGPPEPGTVADRQEGIEHVIFKGDKGKIKVRADRFFYGEDRLDHLEGNVEVVDYGRKGGRELTVTADKVDYDQDMTFFRVSGKARVQDGDSVFESPSFVYDKVREIVRTRRGVVFHSDRLDAKSRNLKYVRQAETFEFSGEVAVELRPRFETSLPLSASGDSFFYRRTARAGRMEGNARMAHGKSRGSADKLAFVLTEDEQQIEAVALTGSAVATFFKEASGEGEAGQDISAGEIRMVASPDGGAISRLRAMGGCVIKLELEAGARDEVAAETAVFSFDPDGAMKEFEASGSARLTLGAGTDNERRVRGDSVIYAGKEERLEVRAGAGPPARVDSSQTEIEASTILVELASGNMTAEGAVKLVLKPAAEGRTVGFFAKDKPVFTTCRTLYYDRTERSFTLRKSVRIWQEKDVLLADKFDILEESGTVSGRGKVSASFTHKPKERTAEERLEIGAEQMDYLPGQRKIAFAGACALRTAALRMTAAGLDIRLAEEGSAMEGLLARGKVVIVQEGKEGRGEEALYDLNANTVVLTGNPVLIDKDKGITEGDKLTFHLGDGRISIENKERDRSATIIKS